MIIIALVGLVIATLSTNLAANVVSPANGFSNLLPRVINFRRGALITAVIGLVILPWKMWEDPDAYVLSWLVGCGGLLGAVGGIMIADYFVIRKKELDVEHLYRLDGKYSYLGGVNPVALVALVAALVPLVPGFLGSLGVMAPPDFFVDIYKWSWFVAFFVAREVYVIGMMLVRERTESGGARD